MERTWEMKEMDIAELAYETAVNAHKGQVDKAGIDYIQHPVAVAEKVETPVEKAVAYLHDVVEDTDVTLDDLRQKGFPEEVVTAVDCLTKRDGEPLPDYLLRVKGNALARTVKLADLAHNSDIRRIPHPKEKDFRRVERYHREAEYLRDDANAGQFEE